MNAPYLASEDGPTVADERPQVTSPAKAAAIIDIDEAAIWDREVCVLITLNTKHRLIDRHVVSIGSVDHTFMSPREVFRDALLDNATAIVLAHNHPSGDPEPSRDDKHVTKRLAQAGEVIGINLLDHLVIGRGTWVSMARRGLI